MRSVSNYRLLYVALLLTALSCPAAAHNGAVAIAVPLEGIVVDGDLSDWLSWGQLGGLGDVVLAGQGAGVGNMAGRITWQTGQGVARTQVKIFSSDSQEPLAQVWTDQQGYYATILPSGTYRIEPAIGHTRGRQVEIRDGRSAEVEEMAIAHPLGSTARSGVGKHRKAGGRSVKAGMGERHGAWRTLAVADGLPDPSVTDIAQDREGICGLPPTATAWPATMALPLVGYSGSDVQRDPATQPSFSACSVLPFDGFNDVATVAFCPSYTSPAGATQYMRLSFSRYRSAMRVPAREGCRGSERSVPNPLAPTSHSALYPSSR